MMIFAHTIPIYYPDRGGIGKGAGGMERNSTYLLGVEWKRPIDGSIFTQEHFVFLSGAFLIPF